MVGILVTALFPVQGLCRHTDMDLATAWGTRHLEVQCHRKCKCTCTCT